MIGLIVNLVIVLDRIYNVNSIVYGGGGSLKVYFWYVVLVLEGIC